MRRRLPAPPEAPPAFSLGAEPRLAVEPPWWVLPMTRRGPVRPRREARPFSYSSCLARLDQARAGGPDAIWNLTEEVLPHTMTAEEARFWLLAITGTPNPVRRKKTPPVPTEQDCRTPLSRKDMLRAINNCYYPDQAVWLPLLNLLSVSEALDILARDEISSKCQADLSYITYAFHPYLILQVLPFWTDAEIEALRDELRRIVSSDRCSWDVWPLLGYLEMFPEVEAYVSYWEDGQSPCGKGVALDHLVFNLATPELVVHHGRRLRMYLDYPETLHAWLYRTGLTALDHVRDSILQQEKEGYRGALLAELSTMAAPELAPLFLEVKVTIRKPAPATAWLEGHPGHAIAGLVPVANGRGKLADAALTYLREAKRKGFGEAIALSVEKHPPEAVDRVRREVLESVERVVLAFDEKTTPDWLRAALPASGKPGKANEWLRLTSLSPLTVGNRCFNDAQVQALLAELRRSTLEAPRPLVAAVRQNVAPAARDAFVWSLFECWLEGGAPSSDRWGILSLGLLGGDGVALKLAPLVRAWPGQAQHRRAVTGLECLRAIGTDSALIQLNGIAQKLRFQGLKNKAREMIEGIAADRGLSRDQLEDRIVPDLGLGEEGGRILDLGGLQYRVVLQPDLTVRLRDAAGKLRADLPKPASAADAERAKAPAAEWKLLKQQLREVARVQVVRLEQAMVVNRRWPLADFEQLIVGHPLLFPLARPLVWGGYDSEGGLARTFRLSEEGTCIGVDGAAVSLEGLASVGIVHPLHLDDGQRAAWTQALRTAGVVPPFAQMLRPTCGLEPGELGQRNITRFAGIALPGVAVAAHMDMGNWERGFLGDHGDYWDYHKTFPAAGVTAVVGLSPGLMFTGRTDEEVTLPQVFFVLPEHLSEWYAEELKLPLEGIDRVVFSEVLADLHELASRGTARR